MNQVLIVGSVAYDALKTPFGSVDRALGGSATYSSLAASLFAPVAMVGVVGTDFRASDLRLLVRKGIDTSGLKREAGKTFFWKGFYEGDMNVAHTVRTELNVFAGFDPVIPSRLRRPPYLFLANIHPALQASVLDQVDKPRYTVLDTMNLWIQTQRKALLRVLRRVDLAVLNDQEVRLLTGITSLAQAARKVRSWGPRTVIVKKGEHGAFVAGPGWAFMTHAVPLERVVDPTGAGDSFAGGMIGYLAREGRTDETALRKAVLAGGLVASFTVQGFSVRALTALTRGRLRSRYESFRRMSEIPRIRV
jgi:sugar/nucleoside kinase (ribokinase family)